MTEPETFMLAGPSDAGLAEPGMCTAISLLQITISVFLYRNRSFEALIFAHAIQHIANDTVHAFVKAQDDLALASKSLRQSLK